MFKLCVISGRDCYYNVDTFLKFIKSRNQKWQDRLDGFTATIDKRVSIDKEDPKIKPIYDEMHDIIMQIASGLKKNQPEIYSDMEVILTGSHSSRVKVGLPHEADYLFKLPPHINTEGLRMMTSKDYFDVCDLSDELCDDINIVIREGNIAKDCRLKINALHKYTRIPGVCILMSFGEDGDTKGGASMDIVLVQKYKPEEFDQFQTLKGTISSRSKQFVTDNGHSASLRNSVYNLVGRWRMDTGITENALLTGMDNSIKQGYRVAKYLLQLVHGKRCSFSCAHVYNKFDENLYGCKPLTRSYHLRCVFLHLLIHIHDTDYAEQLKGGTLALCLLDIMHIITEHKYTVPNPLTQLCEQSHDANEAMQPEIYGHFKPLVKILMESNIDIVDTFPLLNTDGIPDFKTPESWYTLKYPIPDDHYRVKHRGQLLTFNELRERIAMPDY